MVVVRYHQSGEFPGHEGTPLRHTSKWAFSEFTKQTLILCYVTIPSPSIVSPDMLRSPKCLAHYSVREVTVRRFIPARMRD